MTTTPSRRRSAAGIITGLVPVTVTPGDDSPSIRQAAGWGFTGIVSSTAAPAAASGLRFVYRNNSRLRAVKRA